jgi:hypothetical protein
LPADASLEGIADPARRAAELARIRPSFTLARYGTPAYAQLAQGCPEEIRAGAEDGSEMRAFAALQQPQREADLRARLDEYVPYALETAPVFVT